MSESTPATTETRSPRNRVLVVDDEPSVLRMLQFGLQDSSVEIRTATNGEDGLRLAEEWRPDLVILDLLIGDVDGFEICRHLRLTSTMPIMIVTALRSDQVSADCLAAGADECINKPFSVAELTSRVRGALRRRARPIADDSTAELTYDRGRFRIDLTGRLVWLDDEVVPLSSIQFRLLAYLAARPNQVLDRAEVYERVWGADQGPDAGLLGAHLALLERRLSENPRHLRYIAPVEGAGLQFVSH